MKATVSVPAYEGMTTTTDADGNYRFAYVPADAASLHVEAQGYTPADVEISIADGATTVKDITLRQLANTHLKAPLLPTTPKPEQPEQPYRSRATRR